MAGHAVACLDIDNERRCDAGGAGETPESESGFLAALLYAFPKTGHGHMLADLANT